MRAICVAATAALAILASLNLPSPVVFYGGPGWARTGVEIAGCGIEVSGQPGLYCFDGSERPVRLAIDGHSVSVGTDTDYCTVQLRWPVVYCQRGI